MAVGRVRCRLHVAKDASGSIEVTPDAPQLHRRTFRADWKNRD